MKAIFFKKEIAWGVSFFIAINLSAQQLPVTPLSLDEDLRFLQLSGQLSQDVSLTVRPTMPEKKFTMDSLYKRMGFKVPMGNRWSNLSFFGKAGKFKVLPTAVLGKMNSL